MNADALVEALGIPAAAKLDRRVPKKLLLENGGPTAADKRLIGTGIETITWVAALKPGTVGVPAFANEEREYLEIAVIAMAVREDAKATRLAALVHRAIPYPVLLVLDGGRQVALSAAHKRRSLAEVGNVVLEDEGTWATVDEVADRSWLDEFLAALALARQPRASMFALYQGWIDTLVALVAARITGNFRIAVSGSAAAERRSATTTYDRTQADIDRIHTLAVRETQLSRRVELNQQLAELRATLAETRTKL